MFRKSSQSAPATAKRKMPNKLIAGFAALSTTAIIAASGYAAAATPNQPSKADCKKAGFTDYSQCLQAWERQKNGSPAASNGYGGNGTVTTNINLSIDDSNNNIIQVIVNIFN